jgi:hypothetical protein
MGKSIYFGTIPQCPRWRDGFLWRVPGFSQTACAAEASGEAFDARPSGKLQLFERVLDDLAGVGRVNETQLAELTAAKSWNCEQIEGSFPSRWTGSKLLCIHTLSIAAVLIATVRVGLARPHTLRKL